MLHPAAHQPCQQRQWELIHGDVTSVGKKVMSCMNVQHNSRAKTMMCEDAGDSCESAFVVKENNQDEMSKQDQWFE